jgi:hypothetical protein
VRGTCPDSGFELGCSYDSEGILVHVVVVRGVICRGFLPNILYRVCNLCHVKFMCS